MNTDQTRISPARSFRPCRTGRAQLRAAIALGIGVAVAGALWWGMRRSGEVPSAVPGKFPLPTISASPFANTGSSANYVGSEKCQACHAGEHDSFRHTGMGRSMALVDLAREPASATFNDRFGRRYDVSRNDGKLWHRESLVVDGHVVALAEHPVKYVVGSGRHSLTYLVEAEGFLVESPITWYASRKAWDLSPGYNVEHHGSFERATGEGCLECHAGRVRAVDRSLHRMEILETAIGCERCHGPGSLHVEKHSASRQPAAVSQSNADFDDTIVNPAHLSRDLAEAICQQCHLRSTATVPHRGRRSSDFRPGLPLHDFRADYRLETSDAPMTVVGHVEQLHLSRCYQRSSELSCRTCHNPHGEPAPDERLEHYKAACVQCHAAETCTVSPDRRARESPADDCVHCHMPQSDTEIPHLAFTHHRIGLHTTIASRDASPHSADRVELLPLDDLSRLGEIDRKRSLGLGYLEAANRVEDPNVAEVCRQNAYRLLSEVHAAGLPDTSATVSLARLRFDLSLPGVLPLAESALSHSELEGQDRCNALFLLADAEAARGRHQAAVAALHELVRLRRHSIDWLLLAKCESALGHADANLEALATAARINPHMANVHRHLAEEYRRKGDEKRAKWHEQRGAPR